MQTCSRIDSEKRYLLRKIETHRVDIEAHDTCPVCFASKQEPAINLNCSIALQLFCGVCLCTRDVLEWYAIAVAGRNARIRADGSANRKKKNAASSLRKK